MRTGFTLAILALSSLTLLPVGIAMIAGRWVPRWWREKPEAARSVGVAYLLIYLVMLANGVPRVLDATEGVGLVFSTAGMVLMAGAMVMFAVAGLKGRRRG
ncbi:hypothetical protein GCM10010193_10110 [Kitasatospora atroaurantiaca]|uniref:Uncharacterized protein n=1 Tax=Kitasatospora atroaurantiaca TaxID=285545 RepID=A0A561ES64_9ACTN|nr:hypothetical protein [Kitasatospora atroaurantiaca]TWE18460.1 hypothetical protein FB465_3536 [Kitasatospora atroaurantiaca]